MIVPSFQPRRKARIEIIPLIDIIFFLLATFVMISLSMVKNVGVDVNLPSATTSFKQVKDSQYTAITVTDKGEIYFNKEKIPASELPARLKQLKKINHDPTIVLNGDEKASYGRAIFVLDEARRIGIKKVALETKQP
ncbi:MAG: hypothetical protein AUJ71_00165 [Candidatus Omnitrophica bacterium CG1_02_49_16]|nr:MAG: hypothetical protein AUJ71_00165 [Candidatus Omnitrophica bacterium CG1_02_49_16]